MFGNKIKAIALASALGDAQALGDRKGCNALALSGGGALGSYEAGVMWGMYFNAKDKSDYAYDVVTGVSAGAINSAGISTFAPGDEENMLTWLSESWQNLKEKDVFTSWSPLGVVTGLTKKSGIFDTQPLYDYIDNVYKDVGYQTKRKLGVSCVDVNSGTYHVFNETYVDIVRATVASGSIPFVFPHQILDQDGT